MGCHGEGSTAVEQSVQFAVVCGGAVGGAGGRAEALAGDREGACVCVHACAYDGFTTVHSPANGKVKLFKIHPKCLLRCNTCSVCNIGGEGRAGERGGEGRGDGRGEGRGEGMEGEGREGEREGERGWKGREGKGRGKGRGKWRGDGRGWGGKGRGKGRGKWRGDGRGGKGKEGI